MHGDDVNVRHVQNTFCRRCFYIYSIVLKEVRQNHMSCRSILYIVHTMYQAEVRSRTLQNTVLVVDCLHCTVLGVRRYNSVLDVACRSRFLTCIRISLVSYVDNHRHIQISRVEIYHRIILVNVTPSIEKPLSFYDVLVPVLVRGTCTFSCMCSIRKRSLC